MSDDDLAAAISHLEAAFQDARSGGQSRCAAQQLLNVLAEYLGVKVVQQ